MPAIPIPGVPPLLVPPGLSALNSAVSTATLLTADVGVVQRIFSQAPWGIYLDGKLVITADSVVSLEYRRESHISNYPQEEGAFQSYNKVALPFDVRIEMTRAGSEADRVAFLAALETISASLDLYDVVTPEATYTGANVQRYDYRRRARNGVGLITADIWLVQVRDAAANTLSISQQPSGALPTNTGVVQPQTPTQAQINSVGTVY